MKIAFCWSGVRLRYGKRFKDGLWAALEILKTRHTIGRFEPEEISAIVGFKPDVILYWGAFIETTKNLIASLPFKKAICFAGGPISSELAEGFDLYFTESKVSEDELGALGKPWMRAFGVNEQLYKPLNLEKKYDGIFFGTHAQWKRNDLFGRALGRNGISVGIFQDHEKDCYQIPQEQGCEVRNEVPREMLVQYINQSHTAVNTANIWGGGQRMTLEAMACNVPPIVMQDSPKNMEYVLDSGQGLIVAPNEEAIREAIKKLKDRKCNARNYILSKYTSEIYANQLEKGLLSL